MKKLILSAVILAGLVGCDDHPMNKKVLIIPINKEGTIIDWTDRSYIVNYVDDNGSLCVTQATGDQLKNLDTEAK